MSSEEDPLAHWEQRYAGAEPVWSGRVNPTLAAAVAGLPPGRSVDLGCGEGGDVLWLAQQGWQALGLDLAPTAVARAREAASARELGPGSARFEQCDLSAWEPDEASYDLVTASFFHSRVALDRTRILRRAARALAPEGLLVVVSHAAPPPWAQAHDHEGSGPTGPREQMLTAQDEADELALDPSAWAVEVAEQREREADGPDGQHGHLEDSLLIVRRTASETA
ncbi:class I SAM-dependent methyltransferase [Brachybacterium sp. GCM10030268]|uniref:class I SAM-dependent methyltransferase n=1 Tax=Brachybacterium sp. GCM10030268 TaxID=3273382 RepID=UPI00360C6AB8